MTVRSGSVRGVALRIGLLALAALVPGGTAQGVTSPPSEAPTTVSVGLYIVDVTAIRETDNTFEVELDVVASWRDPRVAFEAEPGGSDRRIYLGAAAEQKHAELWRAQVIAVNAVGKVDPGTPKLTIFADGRVLIEARMNAVLRAPLDFRRFPFDHQVLPIHLESFAWNRDAVRLQHVPDQTGFDPTFELPEWTVEAIEASVSEVTRARDRVPFSRLTFRIGIARKSGFYFWKILLPLFTIVAISWVVFWMSEEALGRRAGVSVTGILTVIAYQFIASDALPRVPYLTTMDKIMLLSLLLIATTLLMSVVVDRLESRGTGAKHRVDRACRWVFPLLYFGTMAILAARDLAA